VISDQSSLYTEFINIPFLVQSFALIYHIPELSNNGLVLSLPILADISLGNIVFWNDSALVALNPILSTAGAQITLLIRFDPNTIIGELTSVLYEYSNEWSDNYGHTLTRPEDLFNKTSILETNSHVFSTFSEVFANPYSISIASYVLL